MDDGLSTRNARKGITHRPTMSTLETVSQHTPGPWRVSWGEVPSLGIRALGVLKESHEAGKLGESICIVSQENNYEPHDQANAMLISAAPNLLEALEMLIHFEPNKWAAACSYERGCWEAAKTAIAKAKNLPSRPADDDGEPQSSYCSSQKPGPVGDSNIQTPETDEVLRRNAESDQTPEEDYEALADHAANLEYRLSEARENIDVERERADDAGLKWKQATESLAERTEQRDRLAEALEHAVKRIRDFENYIEGKRCGPPATDAALKFAEIALSSVKGGPK